MQARYRARAQTGTSPALSSTNSPRGTATADDLANGMIEKLDEELSRLLDWHGESRQTGSPTSKESMTRAESNYTSVFSTQYGGVGHKTKLKDVRSRYLDFMSGGASTLKDTSATVEARLRRIGTGLMMTHKASRDRLDLDEFKRMVHQASCCPLHSHSAVNNAPSGNATLTCRYARAACQAVCCDQMLSFKHGTMNSIPTAVAR
jgi:hypothetical protein